MACDEEVRASWAVTRGRRGGRGWLPLWAGAALVALAALLPVAYLLLRAGAAGDDAWRLLVRPRTLQAAGRSIGLALAVAGASSAIALPLAWLTVRTDLPLRKAWAVLTALPLVIPSYMGGLVIIGAFGPRGLLQGLLAGALGVERLPEVYGFPGAFLALTLFSYPYVLLALRAGFLRLDRALGEASRSLGQSPWATFRRVTLPQLRPALAGGALVVLLYALSDFGAVSLLQYDTLTRVIHLQYQGALDRSVAALMAALLVAISAVVLLGEAATRGRARYCRASGGAARPAPAMALGPWRWPATLYCAAVVLLALVLPVALLVFWLVRGLAQGDATVGLGALAWNSARASGLAALAATVAAVPVALLVVRRPGRASALVERAAYASHALPGIVIALALVFFGARVAWPLYQTLALLVFAYVVRFLPQAIGPCRGALLQVRPSLEEAARTLGRARWGAFASISLPLIRPGLVGAFAMVFLTAMKELPATLLLSPPGFRSLATHIWSATAEGFFARAAAPALLLVGLSGASLALVLRTEGRVSGG